MARKRGKFSIVEGDSPVKDHLKDSARTRFIAQGATSEASTSLFLSSFIVPFARAIGANVAHIGFLSAFSGIIAPLGNLWGSKLMEKHSANGYTWCSLVGLLCLDSNYLACVLVCSFDWRALLAVRAHCALFTVHFL